MSSLLIDAVVLKKEMKRATDKLAHNRRGKDSNFSFGRLCFSTGNNNDGMNTKMRLYKILRRPVIVAAIVGSGLTAWHIKKAYMQYSKLLPSNPSKIGRLDKDFVYTHHPGSFKKHFHMVWPDGVAMLEKLRLWTNAIKKEQDYLFLEDEELGTLSGGLDYKTKIALARQGSDLRIFKQPSEYQADAHPPLAYTLRELVKQLFSPQCLKDQVDLAYRHIANSIETVDSQSLIELSGFDAVTGDNIPHRRVTEETVVLLCLFAILAHSRLVDHLSVLVDLNVAGHLALVYGKYGDNPEILCTILKILANISVDLSSAQSIEESGCLYILAKAAQDEDIYLSFPAKRALQNLDRPKEDDDVLLCGIYQMFPEQRYEERDIDYDVVFVHGLLGSAYKTWRRQEFSSVQEERQSLMKQLLKERKDYKDNPWLVDGTENNTAYASFLRKMAILNENNIPKNYHAAMLQCPENILAKYCEFWPKDSNLATSNDYYPYIIQGFVSNDTMCWPKDWLPLDCPNGRVINVDFETFLSKLWPMCTVEQHQEGLESRGKEMLGKLVSAGVGKKPIVFVSHSMGGLIVKHMLAASEASNDPAVKAIAEQTKSVFFYSTPHYGSDAGRKILDKGGKLLAPTREFEEIAGVNETFPDLIALQEKFCTIYDKYGYKLISLSELKPSYGPYGVELFLVPRHSSDMGHGENYAVYLDHLNICKPFCRHSFVYTKLVAHLQELFPYGGEVNTVTPSFFLSKDSDPEEVCSRLGLGNYGIIDPHLVIGKVRGPKEVEKMDRINRESESKDEDEDTKKN